MLHHGPADQRVHATRVTVAGPLGPGARHEPDTVAQGAVALHPECDQPLSDLHRHPTVCGAGMAEQEHIGNSGCPPGSPADR
ncbi:hypothetical protein NONI108955_14235 [Nocardia ninae]